MMLVTFPNFAANIRIKSVTCNFLVKFLSTPAEISCFSIILCTIDDLVAKVAPRYAKSCHCGEKTCRSLNHYQKKEIYGVLARRLRRIRRFLLYLRNLRGKYRVSWHADYAEYSGPYCICGICGICVENTGCLGTQITYINERRPIYKIGDKGERIAPISYAEWLLFIFAPTPTLMEQP